MAIRTDEEEERTSKKTKTLQKHQQEEVDRISQLTDDILHTILGLLTIKEACITTALSKRWRDLFPSLPRLDFDDFSFDYTSFRSRASWNHKIDIARWLVTAFDVLLSRRAPFRTCTITSDYFEQYDEYFGTIIRFLCKNGIRELTLYNTTGEHYTVPSCLYHCRTPTRIELHRFILKVPSKFSGLRRLNVLKLDQCVVEDGDMHRLVSGCRAVERLTVDHCYRLRSLVVDAHKLAALDVGTHRPLAVSIGKAPRLESVTLRFWYGYHPEMYQTFLERDPNDMYDFGDGYADARGNDSIGESDVSSLVRFLESLGNTRNLSLEFDGRYMEIWRTGGLAVTETLGSLLPKMKRLTLKMQLINTFTVSILSCLLNNCPNLEDIVIGDNDCGDHGYPEASVLAHWDQQMPSDCMRNSLRAVTLYLDHGYHSKFWINLVKFLVNNARVLKNLVVDCYHSMKDKGMSVDFQRELLLLRPASPDAVVELRTARLRGFYLV